LIGREGMVMTYNFATAPLLTNPYNDWARAGRCGGATGPRRQRSTDASAWADLLRIVKVKNSAQPKAMF
jgi:hypothetical protein